MPIKARSDKRKLTVLVKKSRLVIILNKIFEINFKIEFKSLKLSIVRKKYTIHLIDPIQLYFNI